MSAVFQQLIDGDIRAQEGLSSLAFSFTRARSSDSFSPTSTVSGFLLATYGKIVLSPSKLKIVFLAML
jgi:hypothetical protein